MDISVECQTRPEESKPRALRRQGFIPCVLYGHDGDKSTSLVMKSENAQNLLKKASVNNTLVDLNVSDLPWNGKVLIREVQSHPWKKTLWHLSFFSVASQGTVEVTVPIKLVGEASGLKKGGIVEQLVTDVKVQCAPGQIPESIDIDMSNMEIGSSLHIHELVIPQGITIMDDPEKNVFSILAPAKTVEATEESPAL